MSRGRLELSQRTAPAEQSSDDETDHLIGDESESEMADLKDREMEEDYFGDDLFGDICRAMYAARYLGPILMVTFLFIGYSVVIQPYLRKSALGRDMISHDDLQMIRPMLADGEMEMLKTNTRYGETNFCMPEPSKDQVKLRFHAAATKKGTHQPPELFYQGVVFGLTDQNSHDLLYTEGKGSEHKHKDHRLLVEEVSSHRGQNDLHQDLINMSPKPTAVMKRQTKYNTTGWEEHGYAVYFAYDDLKKQGKWSTDKLQPFKRVLSDVLVIARHYRQVYVTAWYPHAFGKANDDSNDPHRHTTVLQQVIPTRTGLFGIKSIVPVWMSAINHTDPEPKKRRLRDYVYEKEWSNEDHWDNYKPGGHRYRKLTEEEKENYELIKPKGTPAIFGGPPGSATEENKKASPSKKRKRNEL